jgi:hypothetical protein
MATKLLTRDKKFYCGHCGKPLENLIWGIGWRELPFVLLGELIYSGPGADVIRSGDLLVVPFCGEECRQQYWKTAESLGFEYANGHEEHILVPNSAPTPVPSTPNLLRLHLD